MIPALPSLDLCVTTNDKTFSTGMNCWDNKRIHVYKAMSKANYVLNNTPGSKLPLACYWRDLRHDLLSAPCSADDSETLERNVLFHEGRKEMFYLTAHSTHFNNGYMASDIW